MTEIGLQDAYISVEPIPLGGKQDGRKYRRARTRRRPLLVYRSCCGFGSRPASPSDNKNNSSDKQRCLKKHVAGGLVSPVVTPLVTLAMVPVRPLVTSVVTPIVTSGPVITSIVTPVIPVVNLELKHEVTQRVAHGVAPIVKSGAPVVTAIATPEATTVTEVTTVVASRGSPVAKSVAPVVASIVSPQLTTEVIPVIAPRVAPVVKYVVTQVVAPVKTNHISPYLDTQRVKGIKDIIKRDCHRHGYKLGKTVGKGSYATVKIAEVLPNKLKTMTTMKEFVDCEEPLKVAIKIVDSSRVPKSFMEKFFPRELRNFCTLRPYKHVVRVFDKFRSGQCYYVVMEYCDNGDMLERINMSLRSGKRGLGEDLARKFFHMLIKGVHHIHSQGIVHRDLKCENILLDGNDNVKITDFGFSIKYKSGQDDLLKTACGSKVYTAPEVIKGDTYDGVKADIWSTGIILFAMLNGRLPYDNPSMQQVENMKLQKLNMDNELSVEARLLVRRILKFEPDDRPTTKEILTDAWLVGKRVTTRAKPDAKQTLTNETDTTKPGPATTSVSPEYIDNVQDTDSAVTVRQQITKAKLANTQTGPKKNLWIQGPPVPQRANLRPHQPTIEPTQQIQPALETSLSTQQIVLSPRPSAKRVHISYRTGPKQSDHPSFICKPRKDKTTAGRASFPAEALPAQNNPTNCQASVRTTTATTKALQPSQPTNTAEEERREQIRHSIVQKMVERQARGRQSSAPVTRDKSRPSDACYTENNVANKTTGLRIKSAGQELPSRPLTAYLSQAARASDTAERIQHLKSKQIHQRHTSSFNDTIQSLPPALLNTFGVCHQERPKTCLPNRTKVNKVSHKPRAQTGKPRLNANSGSLKSQTQDYQALKEVSNGKVRIPIGNDSIKTPPKVHWRSSQRKRYVPSRIKSPLVKPVQRIIFHSTVDVS